MTAPLTAPHSDRRATSKAADRAVRAMRAEKRKDGRRADRAIRAASRKRAWRAAGRLARRAAPVVGAAVPVALVNATAFIGQFGWVQQHVPWAVPLQVMFAVTLESVAVYLAWHAHLAQLANDSAGRLKLGAYSFALVIGAMNYSHYASSWHPNALAVSLGLMSALSPWLWGVHSRRASRDRLMERGLVEEHAVRLGANRWTWHPVRSTKVMFHATWIGESNPKTAIEAAETITAARRAERDNRRDARRDARNSAPAVAQPARHEAVEPGAPAAQPVTARQEMAQLPAGTPLGAPLPAGAVQHDQLPIGTDETGRAIYAGAPSQEAGPARDELERLADAGLIRLGGYTPKAPSGSSEVIPGTELNGRPVRAIAELAASPKMNSVHPIDPEKLAAARAQLDMLPVDSLPSYRDLSDVLCPDHDHRRQAERLIKERKAKGAIAPAPFVPRLRTVPNGARMDIATPVTTLPGGAPAND